MPMTEQKFVDVDGIKTSFFEAGAGEPLVLFHGGNFGSPSLADSALDFSTNFDELARRFHVFAIDRVGQGFTENPRDLSKYTMQGSIEHAISAIEALGLRDLHLLGHSRGGYLVCAVTLQRPDLVKTVTIVDSTTLAPGIGRNDVVLANPPGPSLSAACQRWVLERFSYSVGHITDDWINQLVEIGSRPAYLEACSVMIDQGLLQTQFIPQLTRQKSEIFGQIRDTGIGRPTHIIWGYNDPTAPIQGGQALYDLCAMRERRTQMTIINQAGHFSFREHPVQFNACVTGFIQGVG